MACYSVPLPPGQGGRWFSTVEMYDPVTDTWTRKADMPTPRGSVGCVAAYGKIYVIGGRSGSTGSTVFLPTTEEYDPATDTWTQRANMPVGISSFGSGEVNGRIYVIGGGNLNINPTAFASVLEYTPSINAPRLQISRGRRTGQNFIGLKWLSRADCVDSLQFRREFAGAAWTDVGNYPGTDDTVTVEIPEVEPTGFYRLLRDAK